MSIIGILRTNVHSCFKGLRELRSVGIYDIVAYPGILFRGVQEIQLRTEAWENCDRGGGGGAPQYRGLGAGGIWYKKIIFK